MIKPTKLFPLPQDVYLTKKEVEIIDPEKVKEIAARFEKREKAKNR